MGQSNFIRLITTNMIAFWFVLLVVSSCVLAESEKIKATVKSGKTKFSCTFTLANDGAAVLLGDSKVVCTPNKPSKKKIKDFEVSTDSATYKLSFNINPEKLTKASMELKEVKTVDCEAGFTRVCPSGEMAPVPMACSTSVLTMVAQLQ